MGYEEKLSESGIFLLHKMVIGDGAVPMPWDSSLFLCLNLNETILFIGVYLAWGHHIEKQRMMKWNTTHNTVQEDKVLKGCNIYLICVIQGLFSGDPLAKYNNCS